MRNMARITKRQWNFLSDRAKHLDYEKDVDPAFASCIKKLNEINGVATVWCCSGHEKEEHMSFTLPYVVLVQDPNKAHSNLTELVLRLSNMWEDKYNLNLDIHSTALRSADEWNIGSSYRVVTIRLNYEIFKCNVPSLDIWKESQKFIDVLEAAADKVINK